MSPAQSAMVMRKLEELETAYINQAKRLKLVESDYDVISRRAIALGEENERLKGLVDRVDRLEWMLNQVIRNGTK